MIKNDFCKIFGFEEFDKFLGFLKEKNCFNFCRKKILNEICVHCDECSLNEKAIFCLNCFKLSNEKHFFHNKILKFVENGICDCGNFEKIEKKFFCFEHLNEKNNFFLNENKIKNLNDFFCDLIKKIVVFINENNFDFVNEILMFLNEICLNFEILNLISENFIEKIDVKTNLIKNEKILNLNENEIVLINKNKNENLKIPFLFYLIYNSNNKIKENLNDLILNLINNKNFKKNFDIFYLNNLNFFEIENYSISNSSKKIIINNENFLINLFNNLFDLGKNCDCLNNNDLIYYEKYLNKFYSNLKDLINKDFIEKISNIDSIYLNFINLLFIFYNNKKYENNTNNKLFNFNHIFEKICENLLNIFGILINILNYYNKDLIEKIIETFKKNILLIENKKNSYNIILIRAFSLFLNEFCLNFSINNCTDLFNSLKYFYELLNDNNNKINEIIIKILFNFFGFFNSISLKFFGDFSKEKNLFDFYLKYYEYYYFIDISLIKYLLSLEINKNFFTIESIIILSQIENSHIEFLEFINNNNLNKNNKNFSLNAKLLNNFLKIIRSNSTFFNTFLLNGIHLIKKKINVKIFDYFIKNEENFIINLLKEQMIENCEINNNKLNENILEKIFNNLNLDKKIYFDKKLSFLFENFSLKNVFISHIDLDYISNPLLIYNLIKFFNKQKLSILNTFFFPSPLIQFQLDLKCYFNFYFNEKNFKFFENFGINVINDDFVGNLFLNTIFKFIIVFMKFNKFLLKNDKNNFNLQISNYENNVIKKYKNYFKNNFEKIDKKFIKLCEYFNNQIEEYFINN